METSQPNSSSDEVLGLEEVAVGPYCVFDDFRPSPISSRTHYEPPLDTSKETMDIPGMNADFSFDGGMGGQWFSTAEEISLATAADADYGRSDWNEWMQWDPAASQNTDTKSPLNAQGPICYFKPGQKPPIYHRRQNSQLRDPILGLQLNNGIVNGPIQNRTNAATYVFGGNTEPAPEYQFDASSLSSPSVGDGQQNGYYSPPSWNQAPGTLNGNSSFPPVRLEQEDVPTNGHGAPLSTPSLNHSPNSTNHTHTSSSSLQSSPEPEQPKNSKKRKSISGDDPPEGKKGKQPPVKKTAHNMIEKRYRTNLNDKIAALRDSVPTLRVMSRGNGDAEGEDEQEDLEGLTPAHKLNKATVLSKATEYIRHLEKRNERLQEELEKMKKRLENYEKMAMSGPMVMANAIKTQDGNLFSDDPFTGNTMVGPSVSGPPQGMIPVPESMANLHRGLPPQPHYAPQPGGYPVYSGAPPPRQAPPGPRLVNNHSAGQYGRLMVGALAGIMIIDGLGGSEDSGEDRGLFALPINLVSLLGPRVSVAGVTAQFPLFKVLLLFIGVFYALSPFFVSRPKSKKKTTISLSPAPSLASPVEVRRKAWLTAIQTVWVPQHNFLLEAAALVLKSLKLSTRKTIGWPGYAYLTGSTEEEEIARVKAWEIALDAQLTGGDAEISKSRLILTLMASGTLPDTPARLMLKALHIRVLLWEVTHCGSACLVFRELTRSEQKIAANAASKTDTKVEQLPEHLAALLEMECDDVLTHAIVQRAYNLAWNKPSAEATTLDISMDGVVEDFAICSALDALAAWWSSCILNKALVGYLSSKESDLPQIVKDNLDLATFTAPPASQAQIRALVAKAVLLDENRSRNINTAVQALPSPPTHREDSARTIMNLVGNSPIADDIKQALTLAKCLSLTESSHAHARLRAVYALNNIYLPPATMTLLSCVAAYRVLNHQLQDPVLESETSSGLERLVCSVRLWVGHEAGRRSGLSNKARARVVTHCLEISKKLVGLADFEDSDAGYVKDEE
ncbi:hypothetical protein GQ43DRAFT_458588 [Delitschia confertaspora ATCC 74209]|uniref:BHLH domain-containing protein n=1 Tax=Delitschia confertaspora ATCC 74209 TaxID=1513339 RepID=A0A9P4JDN3_9PLEO|nr:hypothetical protein GQ43DRAFT_458588 [Delitschia confertaspora ATCC 74209]